MARVLVNVPKVVKVGEPFDVKVLISHPMESGQRRGADGQAIPRMIITRFVATLDGEEVVSLDLHPAIAANPFLAFSVVAAASGTLALTWVDDEGATQTQLAAVTVA